MSIFSTALLCANSQWKDQGKKSLVIPACRFLHRSVLRHSVTCTIYPSSRVPSQQPTNPFGPKSDIPPPPFLRQIALAFRPRPTVDLARRHEAGGGRIQTSFRIRITLPLAATPPRKIEDAAVRGEEKNVILFKKKYPAPPIFFLWTFPPRVHCWGRNEGGLHPPTVEKGRGKDGGKKDHFGWGNK